MKSSPMLHGRLNDFEATHSLEQARQLAREKGVSSAGTKREILERILVKIAEDINIAAHFDSLLKKWSSEFNVPQPKLVIAQIDTRMERVMPTLCAQDYAGVLGFGKGVIYLHPMASAAARQGPGALCGIEAMLAHEFGHHAYRVKHGRPAEEDEAEAIQMKLVGLGEEEAWEMIRNYLPHGADAIRKTVEAEMARLAREGYRLSDVNVRPPDHSVPMVDKLFGRYQRPLPPEAY